MMKPALFFFSSSFLRSSSLSSKLLPAYLRSKTLTGSSGRDGLFLPQTISTRLSLIPFSSPPPFFLIFSASFRASAVTH